MPCAGLDLRHRLAHHRLVERGLLGGERHEHGRSRSSAAARARCPGRSCAGGAGTAGPGGRTARWPRGPGTARPGRPPAAERLQGTEQPGRGPVEDRPQLGQPVLHRGAGQRDPGRRRECPQRPGGPRQRVLGVLGLVGDDQAPTDLGQRAGVPAHHPVGDQDDLVGGQVVEVPFAAVVAAYRDRRGRTGASPAPSCRAATPGTPPASGRPAPPAGAGAGRSPGSSCPGPCRRPGSRPARSRTSRPARPGPAAGTAAGSP